MGKKITMMLLGTMFISSIYLKMYFRITNEMTLHLPLSEIGTFFSLMISY